MEEKQLSKMALKKMERESRNRFLTMAPRIIMEAIAKNMAPARMMKDARITVDCKNRNRYYRLHYYGATLDVNVYGDGNVEIRIEEMQRGEYKAQLFAFDTDTNVQNDFLGNFRAILPLVIGDFMENLHGYMGYLLKCRDIREAHIMYARAKKAGEEARAKEKEEFKKNFKIVAPFSN